jgi:pimeloyl-ACP methyl ester carboxylesterase
MTASLESHTYDRLSQIRIPTLILHGRKDILFPPENGRILAEAIPGARLIYLENSGHSLLEDMDEVIDSVIDFLG